MTRSATQVKASAKLESFTKVGDVRKFTVEDVLKWASESVGIDDEDAKKLVDQKINGEALLKVTEEKLRQVGIPLGPAIKLMEAINALLNVNTGAPATQRPFRTLSEYL